MLQPALLPAKCPHPSRCSLRRQGLPVLCILARSKVLHRGLPSSYELDLPMNQTQTPSVFPRSQPRMQTHIWDSSRSHNWKPPDFVQAAVTRDLLCPARGRCPEIRQGKQGFPTVITKFCIWERRWNADPTLHQLAVLLWHTWMTEAMRQPNVCNCTQRVYEPMSELPEPAVSNTNTGSCSREAKDHHLDLPQEN